MRHFQVIWFNQAEGLLVSTFSSDLPKKVFCTLPEHAVFKFTVVAIHANLVEVVHVELPHKRSEVAVLEKSWENSL
jgi:hypothetical protein